MVNDGQFPRKLRVSVGSQEPADDHEMDRREAPSDRRHETIRAGHIIEPLLSIDDLAAILRCSRRVVERMRSAGKVPKPDVKSAGCRDGELRRSADGWKAEGGV